MTIRFVVVASMLLVPAVAVAAPPAQVSSEQLVCDLSGECGGNAAAPTRNGPQTRGFSIIHAGSARAATGGHQASTQRLHVVPPGGVHAPRGAVGHADLAIAFLSGSATLTSAGKRTADQFALALQSPALATKRFMIGGHTSAVGSRPYNQDLSERRAQAVVDYLVAQGATRALFDVKGFGFDVPLPGTAAAASANRRVEIVALAK
ncbi:OmpA family protein [Novosphingobium sp.]|uniref:OmpA family protein n=1 Tax=Novosphingobium sp. TaxID=1874826 RepID=UPI003340C6D5